MYVAISCRVLAHSADITGWDRHIHPAVRLAMSIHCTLTVRMRGIGGYGATLGFGVGNTVFTTQKGERNLFLWGFFFQLWGQRQRGEVTFCALNNQT